MRTTAPLSGAPGTPRALPFFAGEEAPFFKDPVPPVKYLALSFLVTGWSPGLFTVSMETRSAPPLQGLGWG